MESDTITAIVTPPGEGGVGIIRTSGPLSKSIPKCLFPRLRAPWTSHRMRYGEILDPGTGRTIDQAMGCFMQSPQSYTGEDTFEIYCHGSPLVLENVLRACLDMGCRAARPGEFTLRAFLNGRMDLSQAEAVIDVVRARTNAGLDLAVQQLTGWLTARIGPLRDELMGVLARMEAMVDFVEDDIPPQVDAQTHRTLNEAVETLSSLLTNSHQGIILREGASLAIVGSPNVGKSSIMNALLGIERSIVTPIAGTTRDTVEETLAVRGIAFRTVDTAGITDTADMVEQLGVERTRRTLEGSDVVLLVLDRSRTLSRSDLLAIDAIRHAQERGQEDGTSQRLIVTLNKADLPAQLDLSSALDAIQLLQVVESSTLNEGGMVALRLALEGAATGGPRHEFVVGNVRHQNALRRAGNCLQTGLRGLVDGTPLDLVALDVRDAIEALGEITGESVDDDLLDRIFRDFCIGK